MSNIFQETIDLLEVERKKCFENLDGEPQLINRKLHRQLSSIIDKLTAIGKRDD